MACTFCSHRNGTYREFSNFYAAGFWYGGFYVKTNEHLFQALKFARTDPGYYREILNLPDPKAAKAAGRQRYHGIPVVNNIIQRSIERGTKIDPDWEQLKDHMMSICLWKKFTEHPELQEKLLETGSSEIVEINNFDRYWARSAEGDGGNRLGEFLMQLRSELREPVDTVEEIVRHLYRLGYVCSEYVPPTLSGVEGMFRAARSLRSKERDFIHCKLARQIALAAELVHE